MKRAVAVALLTVGFLNIARGLSHHGADYRPWALHHASYSDVVALSGDRYAHGHPFPLPYIHDRIEYPVVIGVLLWLPSYVPGGETAYFVVSSLLLAVCLVWAIGRLEQLPGTNAWWLAATPALAMYGLLNWDLVGIALLLAGIGSGALAGLGVATKLFPVAALPAYPRRWRGAAVVFLLVNAPFALLNFHNWSWFFRFNSRRRPDFSIWNALHLTSTSAVNVVSLGIVVAAACVAWRRGRFGVAFLLAVWMATNKVSSPQYSLWVFAAAALVAAPWPLFAALVVGSSFDFAVELWLAPHHTLTLGPLATAMVLTRTAAILAFVAWLWVEIRRDQRGEGGGELGGTRTAAADGLHLAG